MKKKKTQTEIMVRELTVKDESGEIKVSLWDKATSCAVQAGDTVVCKDVLLNFNEFFKEVTAAVSEEEQMEVDNKFLHMLYLYF